MSAIELPEEWGMCGCANEGALRLLRDILRVMAEKSPDMPAKFDSEFRHVMDAWVSRHIARRETTAGGPAQWELFMHYIDKMGWSEHGGGINSSWLTGEGQAALATLEALPLD